MAQACWTIRAAFVFVAVSFPSLAAAFQMDEPCFPIGQEVFVGEMAKAGVQMGESGDLITRGGYEIAFPGASDFCRYETDAGFRGWLIGPAASYLISVFPSGDAKMLAYWQHSYDEMIAIDPRQSSTAEPTPEGGIIVIWQTR